MIRFTPAALAVLALTAAPVLAQTTRPQAPVQRTTPQQITPPAAPAASPAPGSEEWLRLRGETYSAAPGTEQDPAEVAETIRLNAAIVARNNAAERRENESIAAWRAEDARWRAEVARAHGLPAYVIFHDATLMQMACEQPDSLRALAGIGGVGAKKLEAYGTQLLELPAPAS